jgi:predicted nucleotidyltransferase
MRTQAHIDLPTAAIADYCRRWGVTQLALFGSVLRSDFRPDSDVDVLVTFAPDARLSWQDRVRMTSELEAMLGRPVDLVERRAVEESPNYIRRQHILSSAEVVYGA